MHIDKVFNLKTKEGDKPLPNPIRDVKGDVDQTKLKNNGIGDDESDDDKSVNPASKIKTSSNKIKVKKK